MQSATDTMPIPAARPQTAGSARELLSLALPVVLTNLSATLMMTADAAMVGRLGAAELGGVGYAGIWYWTALSLFMGTASGVQTFVAQAHGAGEARRCGGWVWQGFYAVAPAAAIVLGLFAFAFAPLLSVLQPSPELSTPAAMYIHTRAPGVIGLMSASILAGFFRGIGDTRTPLYAMVTVNLVDLGLNYVLIFGHFGLPALGVAGAGASTAFSELLHAGLLFWALRRRRVMAGFGTAAVRPDPVAIRRFLRTSAPIGGQWVLDMGAFAVFSTLVARMGAAEMAASQALISLMHLSFMQVLGVSIAASTLVGRYIGAGDPVAAARSYAMALRFGFGLSATVTAVFMLFPELCLRIYTDDPAVLGLGGPLLMVGAAFGVGDTIGVLAGGALRGAGDTRWPFVVQTLLAWLLFLPLAYVGGFLLDGGLTGAWLGGAGYVTVLGAALHLRFRSGAWRRVRI